MVNSLCGSMDSLKHDNSSTKLPPTSSNESVSESKITTTTTLSSDLEHSTISLTPPSLDFPTPKFELDVDIEVQSPDNSLWESFFSDQFGW